MGSENGSGYAVLDLRMTEAEKDIKAVSDKLEQHINKNDDEHKEMRANIAESTLSVREIKIMMSQMATNSDEMKKSFEKTNVEIKANVKELSDAANKDSGWRAIIIDLLKVIFIILGFIATGKFVL